MSRPPATPDTGDPQFPGYCDVCGNPFVARRPHALYCGDGCRNTRRNEIRRGERAGRGSFEPTRISSFFINEELRRRKRKTL